MTLPATAFAALLLLTVAVTGLCVVVVGLQRHTIEDLRARLRRTKDVADATRALLAPDDPALPPPAPALTPAELAAWHDLTDTDTD